MKKRNNKQTILLLCTALMCSFSASHMAVAGGWGDLKKSLKKEKKQKEREVKRELINKIDSSSSASHNSNKSHTQSSQKSSHSGSSKTYASSQPNPNLRTDVLKCDDIKLQNVQIGNSTHYKVTEGISSSNYTGFINRRKANVSNQCFVGVLQSDECATMEVSKAELDRVTGKDSNNLKMQCVFSDRPTEMAQGEVPKYASYVPLNYMLLKCGHDQGDQYDCDDGSNSQRSSKYKSENLKDKVQLSVCGMTYHLAPKGGEHIYCQYYNKKSKKSIFGFEFNQTRS